MNISESAENYLEAILVLSTQKPVVRSIDRRGKELFHDR